MSSPRRIYFIQHAGVDQYDWRAYAEPPKLLGKCAYGCRVVTYKREPLRPRKAVKKKRRPHG